jgi:pyruvate dehydrogenase E2 component (dihydrolipoamide acetyltransferase)
MPQLGETVTEGTITRWLKQVGDSVEEDEVLFEVSTDKVDSEVPSPAAGVVSEILVPEGETVDVGTKLAVISDSADGGGGGGSATEQTEETRGTEAKAENGSPEGEAPAAEEAPSSATSASAEATPAADVAPSGGEEANGAQSGGGGQQAPAAQAADAPTGDAGAGPEAPAPEQESRSGRGSTAGTSRPAGGAATRPADDRPPGRPSGGGSSKVLSPVVRRLISEHNLDPDNIKGTGAGGRITRSDVLAVIDQASNGQGGGAPAAAPEREPAVGAPAPSAPAARSDGGAPRATVEAAERPAAAPVKAGDRDTVVPFTNIRRRTAEHMVRSKHTSAHTMVAVEVDYSAVDKVRQAEKKRFKEAEGFGLTYLPFIARATIDAIADWPYANSSVGDDELIVHNDVNLGIAVDLDFEGLLVPVIHQADGKRMRQLAREISGLAGKARSRKLTMDDITGGTFTITNAGPFGTFLTVPVINQPQVAILSTDGVRKRPVVVEGPEGDAIAIHPVGHLVMSWDHRAFDGAYAAAFLAHIKDILETRDWSAEL